ncbi:uncharacterized protein dac isoform X4 [Bemisia tabaci]|uniref:uncharacterized protein dac isoform X4 n=1 Tax=Bemisia tabaci TaxID=7038 RepID=UPI003B28938C
MVFRLASAVTTDQRIIAEDRRKLSWHSRCLMSHKTTESSRPGRPPKRAPVGLSLAASHLSQQLKKHRMENGDYSTYENGHLSDAPRLEKSPLLANGYNQPPTHLNHMQFLPMNHPAHTAILPPGLSHHPGLPRPDSAIMKAQGIPGMEALARSGLWENCRVAYEDLVKHLERLNEERGESDRVLALDKKARDLSSQNGSSAGHSPVLNLSKSGGDHSGSEGGHTGPEDDDDDDNASDVDDHSDKEHDLSDNAEIGGGSGPGSESPHALNYSSMGTTVGVGVGVGPTEGGVSSTETLLRNIQGLLKVAADNARQQERQINYEKAELKMDVLREREEKVSIERQLVDEQKSRDTFQKRWRRERKERKRLQTQLETEFKRRNQLLEALKTAGAPPEALRILTEAATERVAKSEPSSERERAGTPNSYAPLAGTKPGGEQTPDIKREREREREKPWNYSGMDLVSSGAAFWQNYSESLAQELEQERKKVQQQQQQQQQQQSQTHVERDVKSPLQDSRAGYYKNSVLFSTAT